MTTPRPASFRDAPYVLDRVWVTHQRQRIVPTSDPSLTYSLPIPRGWGRVEWLGAHAKAGHPEILGIFAPDPDLDGPRVIVSAMRLRWDVDPALWVRYGWERAGWSVATARPLPARWRPRFEVGGLRAINGRVEVRRTTAFVDNARLVRVDVAAPESSWDQLHDVLWPCGVLMALEHPTYRREVEPLLYHGDPRMMFGLPDSWGAMPKPPPWLGASRWIASPTDSKQGSVMLRIDATRWQYPRPELVEVRRQRVFQELLQDGISLHRAPKRVPPGSAMGTSGLAGVYVAAARDRDQPFELRFAHRDLEGWSLDYTAVIPSPERCPLDHMRAIRALEIAVATTQTRPKEHATHAA